MNIHHVDGEQTMELIVSAPSPHEAANRLFICAGTAVFSPAFIGKSSEYWEEDEVEFLVGPPLEREQFFRAIATASLANIRNDGPANNAGWAVNWVDADWDDEENRVRVRARLAVRGSDGAIKRMAYQVIILAASSAVA